MGSFDVPPLGWIVLTGVACGALVVEAQCGDRRRLPRGTTLSVLGWSAPAAFVGCKLAGALDEPGEFARDPRAFVLGPGNAASWGGLVLGGLVAWIVLALRRLPARAFLDAAVPGILVAYAIGRVGCHVAADGCHGVPTDVPWAWRYAPWSVPVHPTALYEAAYALLLIPVLGLVAARARARGDGSLFALHLVALWSFRFAVEFVRANPQHGSLSAAQWASIALVLGGCVLYARAPSLPDPSDASIDRRALHQRS